MKIIMSTTGRAGGHCQCSVLGKLYINMVFLSVFFDPPPQIGQTFSLNAPYMSPGSINVLKKVMADL